MPGEELKIKEYREMNNTQGGCIDYVTTLYLYFSIYK
jgi:hypothetical protein